MLKMVT